MKIKSILILPILFGLIALTACDEDNGTETSEITLSVNGLPSLDDFYVYEGWLVEGNTAYSTGKFTVSASSDSGSANFIVAKGQLEAATDFVITIEPQPDPSLDPSVVKILSGTFVGNSATLSTEHELAIGASFSSSAGKYILATPTNGENTNELSGVWWLDPSGPSKSLVIPELNDGWIYEGWVVINDLPVSTGKFGSAEMADQNAPYSAQLDAPPFPGEDFLVNAPTGLAFPIDLSGQKVVISVEPNPDNSDDPFTIKPLVGNIPDPATDHTLYDMMNNANSIDISGEVSY